VVHGPDFGKYCARLLINKICIQIINEQEDINLKQQELCASVSIQVTHELPKSIFAKSRKQYLSRKDYYV
jgi:hypothetical protein